MKFEINLIFLIKLFCYMTKKSRQNLNILRTKRAFEVKQKPFFIIFKGHAKGIAKNCLGLESVSLMFFLISNTDYLGKLLRIIASSIYNLGTTRKILLFIFGFKMSLVQCSCTCLSIFICFGESQRWSKFFEKLSGKEHFSARVLFIIYINYHGTAW